MSEVVVARLRPHARALFWPTVLLLAVAAALGFSAVLREQWQVITALVLAGVILIAGWLAPLLRWSSRNYTITTRRVIVSSGLLARSRQEMLLSRIADVTVERRGMQQVFRSGDVMLNGEIRMRDVPSASLVQAAIHDLAEADPSPA